jgi:hypothetical protein
VALPLSSRADAELTSTEKRRDVQPRRPHHDHAAVLKTAAASRRGRRSSRADRETAAILKRRQPRLWPVLDLVCVAAERSTAGRIAHDEHRLVTHPDPPRVTDQLIVELAGVPRSRAWNRRRPLRPSLRGGRQCKANGREIVVCRVAVDTISLGVGLHSDPRPRADPVHCRIPAGLITHPMTPRLHEADRIDGGYWLCPSSLPHDERGAEPIGVHRPGVVVAARKWPKSRIRSPRQVSPRRPGGGVPGQSGDGLVEPLPLESMSASPFPCRSGVVRSPGHSDHVPPNVLFR